MSAEHQYWQEIVGAALLGVDRRDPPLPPEGALRDLAADAARPGAAEGLLQQVAATAVLRRAAFMPRAAAAPPVPPALDSRPVTPPAATRSWHRIIADWALLEDEWVVRVITSGHRLAPELVPRLLARHRGDAVRHARVVLAAGPLAAWLVEQSPALACTRRAVAAPEVLLELPELAITPDLAALGSVAPGQAGEVLARRLVDGSLGPAHHRVLQHLLARMPVTSLPAIIAALDGIDPGARSIGLAFSLCDLARLRLLMLDELVVLTELEPT